MNKYTDICFKYKNILDIHCKDNDNIKCEDYCKIENINSDCIDFCKNKPAMLHCDLFNQLYKNCLIFKTTKK